MHGLWISIVSWHVKKDNMLENITLVNVWCIEQGKNLFNLVGYWGGGSECLVGGGGEGLQMEEDDDELLWGIEDLLDMEYDAFCS